MNYNEPPDHDNGMAPPPPPPGDDYEPYDPEAVKKSVSGPAIGLIVYGALSILSTFLSLFQSGDPDELLRTYEEMVPNFQQMMDQSPEFADFLKYYLAYAFVINLVNLVIQLVIMVGGVRMYQMRNYGLSFAAAILACIPCIGGCCCIIGIPLGIWAIKALNREETKEAFA